MAKLNKIYYFITFSFILLLADYFGILNFIKRPIDGVIVPVKKEIFTTTSNVKDIFSVFANYSVLVKFYQQKNTFTKQNEELQLRVKQLEGENQKLRTQLEAPFPASFKFVPGQVVSLTRFMEINVGAGQGIKKGQLVVDGQTLVGIVDAVSANRSNIRLLTDPDFQIAALTSRGTRGSVVGQAEQNILLSRVLQKDPLFIDDQVVTAGEEFVPPNLLIGKVAHIQQEETATYKQAKVVPIIDYNQEKIVFVITSL